jgi:hypothetical protein
LNDNSKKKVHDVSDEQVNERLRALELENALLAQEVKQIHSELDNVKGGIGRGLWILGGGFLTSIVVWITTGGLVK